MQRLGVELTIFRSRIRGGMCISSPSGPEGVEIKRASLVAFLAFFGQISGQKRIRRILSVCKNRQLKQQKYIIYTHEHYVSLDSSDREIIQYCCAKTLTRNVIMLCSDFGRRFTHGTPINRCFLLLRPPAIAAARSIAIGLSVCLSHHVHNVLVLNVPLAHDQSRASISGRDLILTRVANGTAVALPSMPEISNWLPSFKV